MPRDTLGVMNTVVSFQTIRCFFSPALGGMLGLVLVFAAGSVHAANFSWTGGGGADTDFDNPDNWDLAGFPSTGDTAIFNPQGPITVTFSSPATTEGLRIQGAMDGMIPPDVLFDLGTHKYTVTGSDRFNFLVQNADATRTFRLQNGELQIDANNAIWGNGNVNDTEVILRVQEGATLRHTRNVQIGRTQSDTQTNTTTLYVEGGGKFISEWGFSMSGPGNQGTTHSNVNITGLGSTLEAKDSDRSVVMLGWDPGVATLRILDGGFLDSNQSVGVGFREQGEGVLIVSGVHVDEFLNETPSLITGDQLYIGGGRSRNDSSNPASAGGEGLAQFLDGGLGEFNSLIVYSNDSNNTKGTLHMDGGLLDVSSDGFFEEGSIFSITLNDINQTPALTVGNALTLEDPTLQVDVGGGFNGQENDVIRITEFAFLTGAFKGLADGAAFWVGNTPFEINYGTLATHSEFITLTVIPEPTSLAFLLAALSLLLMRRRV